VSPASEKGDDLPETVVTELLRGRKIEAIKLLREEWSIGLKEARDRVEEYIKTQPSLERQLALAQGEAVRVWLLRLVVFIALLIAGYFLSRAL
jgi:ribosomal protein L7/L12